MAFALVQSTSALVNVNVYSTSLTRTFTTTPIAGNLIVVTGGGRSDTQTYTVSDNKGNTYTVRQSNSANNYTTFVAWALVSTTSDTFTVTVTCSSGRQSETIKAFEFSGNAASGVEDVFSIGTPVYGAVASATVTTTAAGDLLFTSLGIGGSIAMTNPQPSGYTNVLAINGTSNSGFVGTVEAAYLETGAAGSYTATWQDFGVVETHSPILVAFKAGASGPTVTSVTQTSGGTEGSPAVMTVALSGATSGSTNFAATLAGVTATGSGTDFTSDLASATYSNGVAFSGGNMVVPDAVSGWTVTISTTSDTLDEANETATLTVGGTAGTLTITDDDAAPTITGTASSTVTAGDPVVITYSPGLSGQTRTYTLALTDGTAVGGTDYDNTTVTGDFAVTAGTGSVSISGSTVTVDPGVTEFTLTIGTTA